MYKNIYFIGIGGIGMSAIARYYNVKGFKVSGYDKTPSPLTHALEAEGIDVHYTDDISYVPADIESTLVVYTPAIPKDMGEVVKPFDLDAFEAAVRKWANITPPGELVANLHVDLSRKRMTNQYIQVYQNMFDA